MPPDEENLFEQGYVPYVRINDNIVPIPIIHIDQDYLESMYRIYARDGYGREMRTEIIYLRDTTPFTIQTRGLPIFTEACVDAINRALSYAIEHYIVDRHTLVRIFSELGTLTTDAIACLVEYTARVVQEYELTRRTQPDAMADTTQQALTFRQDIHTEELINRVRDMERERDLAVTAQDDVQPLRFEHIGSRIFTPVFSEQNATLAEGDLAPFSDEDLNTLLFEGA